MREDESVLALLYDMHREIRELSELVRHLCSLIEAGVARSVAPERSDELVGAEYVAQLFKTSVASVYKGRAGTHHIKWISRHPMRCQMKEAHAALQRYVESKQRRASLIRRTPRS